MYHCKIGQSIEKGMAKSELKAHKALALIDV